MCREWVLLAPTGVVYPAICTVLVKDYGTMLLANEELKETREAALSVRQQLYITGPIDELIIEDDCWSTQPTDVRISE